MEIVIVTGGRNYSDKDKVYEILNSLEIHAVVHGGASGADSLAAQWASENEVEHHRWNAAWDKYGPAAGPKRNIAMLDAYIGTDPLVIVFPGGKGTAHCRKEAFKRGFRIKDII